MCSVLPRLRPAPYHFKLAKLSVPAFLPTARIALVTQLQPLCLQGLPIDLFPPPRSQGIYQPTCPPTPPARSASPTPWVFPPPPPIARRQNLWLTSACPEHRIFIEQDGVPVSPFHDIPLFAKYVLSSLQSGYRKLTPPRNSEQKTILNMIVEIPRWSNGKLEVCLFPHPPPLRPAH